MMKSHRAPKPQPPQSYEIDQRVVANWNGQLTLAKVRPVARCHVVTACRHSLLQILQAKFDMPTAPEDWSYRLHFEGWQSTYAQSFPGTRTVT